MAGVTSRTIPGAANRIDDQNKLSAADVQALDLIDAGDWYETAGGNQVNFSRQGDALVIGISGEDEGDVVADLEEIASHLQLPADAMDVEGGRKRRKSTRRVKKTRSKKTRGGKKKTRKNRRITRRR